MSISTYIGVMGSGKSYEAVLNGVLPAISKGRRVVTNISGVDSEKIRQYLVSKGSKIEHLGHVVVVSNERVLEPDFFCGEPPTDFKFDVVDWIPLRELQYYATQYPLHQGKNFTRTAYQLLLPELKKLKESTIDLGSCLVMAAHMEWKSFQADWFSDKPRGEVFAEIPSSGDPLVKGGDLVVIDEAWQFWSEDHKITAEHYNFFRMHRHYLDDQGRSCDLLVLIQDFPSLNSRIRGLCDLVLKFTKLKTLGFASKYRVDVYEGRPSKSTFVSSSPWQKYKKEIFPLYQSYDGKGGNEQQTDKRQSIFGNKVFLFVFVLFFIFFLCLSYWFYGYIHKMRGGLDKHHAEKLAESDNSNPSKNLSNPSSQANPQTAGFSNGGIPPISPDTQLLGVVQVGKSQPIYFIRLPDGTVIRQKMMTGDIDGWQSAILQDGKLSVFKRTTGITPASQVDKK